MIRERNKINLHVVEFKNETLDYHAFKKTALIYNLLSKTNLKCLVLAKITLLALYINHKQFFVLFYFFVSC